MNVIRGRRQHAEAGRAAGEGGGTLSRCGVLGGLAALPVVLYGVGSAAPALAATATRPGRVLTATGDLVRGAERRYNAPLLTPGTRLLLPAGITAVPRPVRLRRVRRHEGASVPPDQRAAVADVRDTRIATPAGPLPVRIYRPLSPAAPLPTIVWYHGGGWTTGSLETGDIVARALSSGTPAVVVSVAYRLGPEHPWPAATDDAAAALQWAAAHIGELGGDPERIAVGGDSAGGNLAAVAAQLARDSGPRLAAQILLYPVLDLDMDRSDRYPSLRDNADGYYVTRDELRWCVRNYLPAGANPADPRISPALCSDLTNLPATVIAVAEYDPLRDQGTDYAKTLRAVSVPVTVHPGLGLIHGCFDMLGVTAAARDEIDRVLRSIREALAVTSTDDACPGRSQ